MASIKKKVNVPTPIDERETFVSLRKNFAENEQLVQEKLKTLYELQNTDIEIDKLLQLRGELPEEVSALESEVESLKTKKARMEEMIDGYNQGIENDKKHIDELDKEIEEYRKKLENISNSREYDSVNKELENQGLLRAISEKNIREAFNHKKISKEKRDKIDKLISEITMLLNEDMNEKVDMKYEELKRMINNIIALHKIPFNDYSNNLL